MCIFIFEFEQAYYFSSLTFINLLVGSRNSDKNAEMQSDAMSRLVWVSAVASAFCQTIRVNIVCMGTLYLLLAKLQCNLLCAILFIRSCMKDKDE